MGPKKSGVSRTVLTINTKQEIIAKVESGQKMADVARQYGLNRSTVCTILAKKDIIKKTQAAKGVTKITSAKQRSVIHEKLERLLLVWINEREMKRDVTSMAIIQEKARDIFEKLKEQTPGSSSEELEFKASTGWFAKFKKRSGIEHFNQGKAEQSTSQDTTYIGEFGDEETTRGSFDYECNEPDFISDDPLAIEVSADGVDTDPKRNPPPIRPQAKKKRGHKIDMGLINETILRLDKITTKVEKEQAGPDDFEAFGRFIVTSLKRMDPECALEAQSEIRRIVEEALKEIASEDVDEEGTISKMTEDSLHENETPIATSTLDLSRMDEEDGMIQNDSDRTTCSSVLRRKPNEDISMEESSSKDNMDEGPSNKRGETDVAFATARSDKRRRLTSRSEILNHVMSKVDYVMDKVKYGTDTDDYELLGRYVSASLRKMPMQLALRVENDIYSIVIKHKMQSVKKHSKIT